jgi:hypothetical protein
MDKTDQLGMSGVVQFISGGLIGLDFSVAQASKGMWSIKTLNIVFILHIPLLIVLFITNSSYG